MKYDNRNHMDGFLVYVWVGNLIRKWPMWPFKEINSFFDTQRSSIGFDGLSVEFKFGLFCGFDASSSLFFIIKQFSFTILRNIRDCGACVLTTSSFLRFSLSPAGKRVKMFGQFFWRLLNLLVLIVYAQNSFTTRFVMPSTGHVYVELDFELVTF